MSLAAVAGWVSKYMAVNNANKSLLQAPFDHLLIPLCLRHMSLGTRKMFEPCDPSSPRCTSCLHSTKQRDTTSNLAYVRFLSRRRLTKKSSPLRAQSPDFVDHQYDCSARTDLRTTLAQGNVHDTNFCGYCV